MTRDLDTITPEQAEARARARAMLAVQRTRQRNAEIECSRDFLLRGGEEHGERCVFKHACSRTYNPYPTSEAAPTPESDYEGTGIGLLYGLSVYANTTLGRRWVADMAGWTVERGPQETTVQQDIPPRPPKPETRSAAPTIRVRRITRIDLPEAPAC